MNEKILSILKWAYRNSEYYHNLLMNFSNFDSIKIEEFKNIPILDRNTLLNEFDSILNSEYRFLKRKELQLVQTSGSTGQIVSVLWHPRDYIQSNLCLWRVRKKWYNISPNDRQCSFVSGTYIGRTVTSNIDNFIQQSNKRLDLNIICLSDDNLYKYYQTIYKFQPDWIYTSPSALLVFVEFCIKNNLDKIKSIKYIELATEQVMTSTYDYFKKYFDVNISIMYGAKEVNAIALLNPYDNKMHVLQDNVFIEQNEQNEILVTSLKNTVFPIIRYKLGDIVQLSNDRFSEEKYVDIVKGRTRELHFVDKQSGITVSALTNALLVANARLGNPILQYKIQKEDKIFKLIIYIKKEFHNWTRTIEAEITNCCIKHHIDLLKVKVVFNHEPFEIDCKSGKVSLLN